MIRPRHALAGLALVFAVSFGAGTALPRDDAQTETGASARPLGASSETAPIDALAAPPRLPELRRPATSPEKKTATGTSPPPSAEPNPPAIPPAPLPPPQPPPPPPPPSGTAGPEPPEE